MTGDGSFYSAVGSVKGDDDERERRHRSTPIDVLLGETLSEAAEESFRNFLNPTAGRKYSVATTGYAPSSAPSSPQQHKAGDHFLNQLSPPPRNASNRNSVLSGVASAQNSQPPSQANTPPSNFSSSGSVRHTRYRNCTHISIHTGQRCSVPTVALQSLCPAHMHYASSPIAGSTRLSLDHHRRSSRRDDTVSALLTHDWVTAMASDHERRRSYQNTPASISPVTPSLHEGFPTPLPRSPTAPSFADIYRQPHEQSSPYPNLVSLKHGNADHASNEADDQATSPVITVIDWRSNESRRKEYAEVDRRHRGVWGWVRRRIRKLVCSKEQPEFWNPTEDHKDCDGGSVRRYRLVLPDEKEGGEPGEATLKEISAVTRVPCSAPATAHGGATSDKLGSWLEGRRASVAGDVPWGWNGTTVTTTSLGSKPLECLERVDSSSSYGPNKSPAETSLAPSSSFWKRRRGRRNPSDRWTFVGA